MLKFLPLTTAVAIALLSLMPKIAATAAISANSEVNSLPCYMQTSSGKTLDLSTLCSSNFSHNLTQPLFDDAVNVAVSDLSFDGNFLRGQLSNQTGQTIKSATVNYEILDSKGKVIDAGFFDSQFSVPPGEAVPFQQETYPGMQVRIASIDWHY